ncbi:MAG TPA: ATP-binding protein [Usitatibacter sp.]|nr:ATP-binding protein [Usitatibacter sp.]
MTFFPASLRWRTLVVMIAALVLSQVAALWLLHEYVTEPRHEMRVGQFVSHLKTISAALATMDPEQQQRFIASIAEKEGIRILPVRGDEHMRPAADRPPLRFFRERIREIFGPDAEVYVRGGEGPGGEPPRSRLRPPVLWIRLPAGEHGFWVAFPPGRIERDPLTALFAWGAAGLAIAIAATFFLVFRLNRPLGELARAAEKLGKGGDPAPVSETGPSEIRAVARAFNQMKDDLQKSQRERATFLAGISHDLRTPLARLRLEVEMLGDKVEGGTQGGMVQDLDDMNAIIDQFIDFTRSEAAEPLAPIDLAELARSCAERAARGGADVRCELDEVPLMMLRPLAMRRLVDNLIANAARHAGGEIRVRVTRGEGRATLSVLDRGPGIPAGLVERLKQPFTRRDEARSGSSGAGLGLAIADRVAMLHGGTLDLLARAGGGLEARVSLPLAV